MSLTPGFPDLVANPGEMNTPNVGSLRELADKIEQDIRNLNVSPGEILGCISVLGVNAGLWSKNSGRLLHTAVEEGRVELIQGLLEAGADPNARNGSCKTALHVAAASANDNAPGVLSNLIRHGGEVNARDSSRCTALHSAVFALRDQSSDATIALLLGEGADPNARDNNGMTPLHKVHDNTQAARDLLASGADPSAKDHDGNTPLHFAVTHRKRDLVELLLQHDADAAALNASGVSPQLSAASCPGTIQRLFLAPRVTAKPNPRPLTHLQTRPIDPNGRREDICRYFRGTIKYFGGEKNYQACESVFDMLYRDKISDSIRETDGNLRWFHLPATNRLWVEHLVETICSIDGHRAKGKKNAQTCTDITKALRADFNEVGQIGRFRRAAFTSESLSPDEVDSSATQHSREVVSLTLPVVDVDYDEKTRKQLETMSRGEHSHAAPSGEGAIESPEGHARMMMALRNSYSDPESALHTPRTLHASSYDFLEDKDLEKLNGKQVLTEYLEKQKKKALGLTSGTTADVGSSSWIHRAKQAVLRGGWLSRRDHHHDAGAASSCKTTAGNSDADKETIRVQMLVVPQLWLWKIDKSTIITAFPERWDITYRQGMLNEIKSKFPKTGTIDYVIESMVEVCINFIENPVFVRTGLRCTIVDVFGDEIASLDIDAMKRYEAFGKTELQSVNIQHEVREGIHLLKKIDDILDQIYLIKKVMNSQEHVMKSTLRWRRSRGGRGASDAVQGNDFVHQPLKDFTLLQENAERVRHRIITLLDILQREASIRGAQENSTQSKLLMVFTIATVLFAPLSFSQQLLAIPIEISDQGRDFPVKFLSKIAALTLLFTLLFMVILWCISWGYGKCSGFRKSRQAQTDLQKAGRRLGRILHNYRGRKPEENDGGDMENGTA